MINIYYMFFKMIDMVKMVDKKYNKKHIKNINVFFHIEIFLKKSTISTISTIIYNLLINTSISNI